MKQKTVTKKNYRPRLASAFDLLDEKGQTYIEGLTAQLAEIHTDAPETRRLSKKNAKGK
jgi:hypothetical protein